MKSFFFYKIKLIFIFFYFISPVANGIEIEKQFLFSSYLKGINLANASGKFAIKSNKFYLNINNKTVGIFSIISNWKQSISVEAVAKNNLLVSQKYMSDDVRGNKKGHMHLIFTNIFPEIISAQPDPRDDNRRENISNDSLINTRDPVIGIINTGLTGNCNKKEIIFDGKRKYALITKFLYKDIIKKNDFYKYDINSIKCAFDIEKLAGYTDKEKKISIKRLYLV